MSHGVTVGMGNNAYGNTAVNYLSLYSLIHYAQWRHSLGLICGDGDIRCRDGTRLGGWEDGVGMGTMFTGTVGDVVQFLSPRRPLRQIIISNYTVIIIATLSIVVLSSTHTARSVAQ